MLKKFEGASSFIHVICFALFPVLFLYANNSGQVVFSQTVRSQLVIFAFAALLWVGFYPLFKHKEKANLLVSLVILLFFTYGIAQNYCMNHSLRGYQLFGFKIGVNTYLLPLWVLMVSLVGAWLLKTKRSLIPLTKIVNMFGGVMIALVLFNIFSFNLQSQSLSGIDAFMQKPQEEAKKPVVSDPLPDIYYIVLDAYSRDDVLEQMIDFDNKEVLQELEDRRFYVVKKGRSNFNKTYLSLCSTLNLDVDYVNRMHEFIAQEGASVNSLDKLFTQNSVRGSFFGYYKKLLRDNRVIRFLKEYGYKIVAYESGYEPTEWQDVDQYRYSGFNLNEFENELINTSMLVCMKKIQTVQNRLHRQRVLYTFNELGNETNTENPKFVFAHVLCPHSPFIFGPDGEPLQMDRKFSLNSKNLDQEKHHPIEIMKGQVQFVNKKILEMVDRILSNSKNDPIIIIQADHGFRMRLKHEGQVKDNIDRTYAIFHTVYLPGQNYSDYYPTMSTVNTFRLVFNQFFGMDYPLTDDVCYRPINKLNERFEKVSEANLK